LDDLSSQKWTSSHNTDCRVFGDLQRKGFKIGLVAARRDRAHQPLAIHTASIPIPFTVSNQREIRMMAVVSDYRGPRPVILHAVGLDEKAAAVGARNGDQGESYLMASCFGLLHVSKIHVFLSSILR